MERRPEDLTLSEVMENVRDSTKGLDKFFREFKDTTKLENFDRLGLSEKLTYSMISVIRNQSWALDLMEEQLQKKNGSG